MSLYLPPRSVSGGPLATISGTQNTTTNNAPSPRRQPIVPPRKPVNIAALKAQLSGQLVTLDGSKLDNNNPPKESGSWSTISFADIPTTAYDHILREVLKGMLLESAKQAEKVLASQVEAAKARAQSTSGKQPFGGVSFQQDHHQPFGEPTPQIAGSAGVEPSPVANDYAVTMSPPSITTLYSRLQAAYNSVMSDFAGVEDTAPEPPTLGSSIVQSSPAFKSFASTLNSLSDRRVRQYESMLQSTRDDLVYVSNQLDDLRKAHDQVHQELTRSYKQYDAVQRQLLDALAREKSIRETHARQDAAQEH